MKGIQIQKPHHIELVDLPDPEVGPGEVMVRVLKAGLCGTDLHLYEGRFGNFPIIPGHDVAGVIEKVGDGVSTNLIGSRVTIDPASCCLRSARPKSLCPACEKGATHLCFYGTYMGINEMGALRELVVVPEKRVIPLPKEINDISATILEPLVVALHLLEKISNQSGSVLIIGGGPIGIMCALVLQEANYMVWLSEPMENRRNLAKHLGVQNLILPIYLDESFKFQILIEASGYPSAIETILKNSMPGSTVILIGGGINIPGEVILTRELQILAVKGGKGLYPEAISWLISKKINLQLFVSHIFPAYKAEEAFSIASRKKSDVTRIALDMTEWQD